MTYLVIDTDANERERPRERDRDTLYGRRI